MVCEARLLQPGAKMGLGIPHRVSLTAPSARCSLAGGCEATTTAPLPLKQQSSLTILSVPLNDPRLICPRCGKLVEVEVDRFEDMFEESELPLDPDDVAPTYHAACAPKTREEWLTRLVDEEPARDGPSGWTAYITTTSNHSCGCASAG